MVKYSTARIGQTLLEKNKELAEQNEILEEQVSEVNEKVSGGCQVVWRVVGGEYSGDRIIPTKNTRNFYAN